MLVLTVFFALLTCASAYRVLQPNGSQGWTNNGSQPVVWERVDTDPTKFAIVLTNQNRAILPLDQFLMAEQDGANTTRAVVNAPSGGWPTGDGFRVNLVRDPESPDAILAQSAEFAIRVPNTTTVVPTVARPTAATPAGPATFNGPTPSADGTPPNASGNPNSAAAITAGANLMVLLGAVTYLLA